MAGLATRFLGGDAKFDIKNFTIREITKCGMAIRTMGDGSASMEETAGRIVRYLYDRLIGEQSGERACSLVRFFVTSAFEDLDDELKDTAVALLGGIIPLPVMKCLNLLGTVGENQEWNLRSTSKGHKVIPLPSEEVVRQIPMMRNLINQMGLSVHSIVKPDSSLLLDLEQKTYNVFFVAEAVGSPHIPAQEDFVVPYGIRSVVGFGGLLPSGDVFMIIMFLKLPISKETADLFKNLSMNIKLAILEFDKKVFTLPGMLNNKQKKPGKGIIKGSSSKAEMKLLRSQLIVKEQLIEIYENSVLENTEKLYAEIATRIEVEDALKISLFQLSAAMDIARIVYFELDEEKEQFILNDGFYAFLKTSAEQEQGYLMGMNEYVKRFIHPDDSLMFYQLKEKVRSNRDRKFFTVLEHRLLCSDGEVRWVFSRSKVLKDTSGNISRVYGIIQDITERKKAEAEKEKMIIALRESLTKIKTLSGLLPICAWCKKIRDDTGYWQQLESYLGKHSSAEFSHSICPECLEKNFEDPDLK
jgi:PAS domain S-box-containing protein